MLTISNECVIIYNVSKRYESWSPTEMFWFKTSNKVVNFIDNLLKTWYTDYVKRTYFLPTENVWSNKKRNKISWQKVINSL